MVAVAVAGAAIFCVPEPGAVGGGGRDRNLESLNGSLRRRRGASLRSANFSNSFQASPSVAVVGATPGSAAGCAASRMTEVSPKYATAGATAGVAAVGKGRLSPSVAVSVATGVAAAWSSATPSCNRGRSMVASCKRSLGYGVRFCGAKSARDSMVATRTTEPMGSWYTVWLSRGYLGAGATFRSSGATWCCCLRAQRKWKRRPTSSRENQDATAMIKVRRSSWSMLTSCTVETREPSLRALASRLALRPLRAELLSDGSTLTKLRALNRVEGGVHHGARAAQQAPAAPAGGAH